MKCTIFVGPFDPIRRPAPGQPPGSEHPRGPRLGWYRSLPGASRRGEYPNGSNIKNIRFVMKCTYFVGPFDPFRRPAPGRDLYQPNLGPHRCLEPGVCPGSKHPWEPKSGWYRSRPGASRRGEYPNGSNIKNIRFVMKCANFVGPFDPFRRPPKGRPPGSKHPWAPRLGWYRSRPGTSRRGEYANGSNIKIIRFVMKCTIFVGPFDPIRRPAPGQPPGSKHPRGPRLGWYRSLPGASRRGEYPNGSNIKNIRFVMKCTYFVGPFDPFRRPAPGRDLYQPNLGPHRCLEPGVCPGAGRLNGSNGPTKLAHFIIKLIILMLEPFGYSPLRLAPGRDLNQPNLSPHRCLEPGGRPGAGRLNGSNGPTNLVHFITKRIFSCWTRLDIRHYGLPQDGTYTNPI